MKKLELEEIIAFVKEKVASETKLNPTQIDPDQYLGVYGLDSINSVHILVELERFTDLELNPLLFWDYPTIKSLSNHLYQLCLKQR